MGRCRWATNHYLIQCYSDAIMSATASQIAGVLIVCSTVWSGVSKKTSKLPPSHWPLWGESTGEDQWIPFTKGQWRGKCFHRVTSSWTKIYTAIPSRATKVANIKGTPHNYDNITTRTRRSQTTLQCENYCSNATNDNAPQQRFFVASLMISTYWTPLMISQQWFR